MRAFLALIIFALSLRLIYRGIAHAKNRPADMETSCLRILPIPSMMTLPTCVPGSEELPYAPLSGAEDERARQPGEKKD